MCLKNSEYWVLTYTSPNKSLTSYIKCYCNGFTATWTENIQEAKAFPTREIAWQYWGVNWNAGFTVERVTEGLEIPDEY